jgi:hypothetical protein
LCIKLMFWGTVNASTYGMERIRFDTARLIQT